MLIRYVIFLNYQSLRCYIGAGGAIKVTLCLIIKVIISDF